MADVNVRDRNENKNILFITINVDELHTHIIVHIFP